MQKALLIILLILKFGNSNSQTYYLEYETNSQDTVQYKLFAVFVASVSWLQIGEYDNDDCSNCETIDDRYNDLKNEVKQISKQFKAKMNNREVILMDCAETTTYNLKKGELYYSCIINEIKMNKIVPLIKIKVTVSDRIKNTYYQVSNIEIIELKGKELSPRPTTDKKYIKAKKDLNGYTPPPIKRN